MTLDLRSEKCPMNLVRAKLALDKIEVLNTLDIYVDTGESCDNVSQSLLAEGHDVLKIFYKEYVKLIVRKR